MKECCVPETPPVSNIEDGIAGAYMEAELISPTGTRYPLPQSWNANVTLRPVLQLSPQIQRIMAMLYIKVAAYIRQRDWKKQAEDDLGIELQSLDNRLHAVRYHQRQFLCRLYKLEVQHSFTPKDIRGTVGIVIDDHPLRFELESFFVNVRSAIDVFGRIIARILEMKCTSYGNLLGELRKAPAHPQKKINKNPITQSFLEICSANELWIQETRKIRDALVHEGKMEHFRSVKYKAGRVSWPDFRKLKAEHACFQTWRHLIGFVEDVGKAIVEPVLVESERP